MAQDDEKTLDQLNEEADIAADYLEELLDIADYDGDIEMGVRNGRPTVQIVADDNTDIKHLIGRDGEVVDALQQLTRLAVWARSPCWKRWAAPLWQTAAWPSSSS